MCYADYILILAASGAGDREVGGAGLVYKEIDCSFPPFLFALMCPPEEMLATSDSKTAIPILSCQ